MITFMTKLFYDHGVNCDTSMSGLAHLLQNGEVFIFGAFMWYISKGKIM